MKNDEQLSDGVSSQTQNQGALPKFRPKTAAVCFLLAWIIVPSILRLIVVVSTLAVFQTPKIAFAALVVSLWGLPQDLLIALQVLLLVSVARAVLPGSRLCLGLIASIIAMLFLVVNAYLLADFLLFMKMGIRMDIAYLEFLRTADSFGSSVMEFGGLTVLIAIAGLVAAAWFAFRFFRNTLPGIKFSWWVPGAALVMGAVVLFGRDMVPPQVGYSTENLVLADQTRFVNHWIAGESRVNESEALAFLRPQAEEYQLVSEDYPLLKRTTGFTGEKQFELNVSSGDRPHVVFLFLESFRAADIGCLGGEFDASPNFDRLAKEGVLFRNFYASGVQTTRAVMASLYGILPRFSAKATQSSNPGIPLIGVADLLNQQGYKSAFITANSLDFENKREFFPNHGYADMLGQEHVAEVFPDADRTSWGLHDEYLMQFLVDYIARNDQAGQAAFITSFTVSHHHPWYVPKHYSAPDFDTGDNDEYGRFLQTFHYTDHCLGYFIQRLKEAGLDQKTIVFVMADTACPQGEHHENFMLVNYLFEENLHIPLLILAPGHLAQPEVVDDLGSQVDLLPTVMDVLGLSGLNHSIGTSLARKVPDRVAHFNNPFSMQYRGLRMGADKYIYNIRSRQSSLFSIANDRVEQNDLAGQYTDLVDQYRRQTAVVNRLFLKLYLSRRFVNPELVPTPR